MTETWKSALYSHACCTEGLDNLHLPETPERNSGGTSAPSLILREAGLHEHLEGSDTVHSAYTFSTIKVIPEHFRHLQVHGFYYKHEMKKVKMQKVLIFSSVISTFMKPCGGQGVGWGEIK